jgi:hypothetical protein
MVSRRSLKQIIAGLALGALLAGNVHADDDSAAPIRITDGQIGQAIVGGVNVPGEIPAANLTTEKIAAVSTGACCGTPACDTGCSGVLMNHLRCTSLGNWLDCNGITVGGWIEQGFTWNPDSPANRFNNPMSMAFPNAASRSRVLGTDRSNEYEMNQLYLYLEKSVDTNACAWDLGGRIDLLVGTDYYTVEALGLEAEQDGSAKWNDDDGPRPGSMYGAAMPQVYGEVFAPIGSGLSVKFGHFYSPLGYEQVPAPNNFFYSHTFMTGYAVPFTHTGVLSTYNLTDTISLQGGMTLGWDNFTNPHDNVGFLGGIGWKSCDSRTSLSLVLHVSEEFDDTLLQDNDRYTQSVVFSHKIRDDLTYVIHSDIGHENDGSFDSGLGTIDAEWYGIAQYLQYEISECLGAGIRFEWFRDDDNARVVPVGGLGDPGNYCGFTGGVNWRPFENLVVRPELRWDWSDTDLRGVGSVGAFDDFSDKNMFTAAVDVIWRF